MFRTHARSISLTLFVVTSVATAACGTSSSDEASPALEGVFRAEGEGATREISFHGDRYQLLPDGCDAPECEEHGSFGYDAKASVLRLTVDDTHREYTMPLTILPAGAVEPPSEVKIAATDLLVERGVALIARIELAGQKMALFQDIPDCREQFGMGTSQSYASFVKDFERRTQFKVRLRHIPGCYEPTDGVYACTTYDAWFKSWDGDGSAASCNKACNMTGGFVETARAAAKATGSSCLAPDNYPFKKKRTGEDDSLDMVRATFFSKAGTVTKDGCRCAVGFKYAPMP